MKTSSYNKQSYFKEEIPRIMKQITATLTTCTVELSWSLKAYNAFCFKPVFVVKKLLVSNYALPDSRCGL